MKTGLAFAAATLTALSAAPALAGDGWKEDRRGWHDDRRGWNDDRRDWRDSRYDRDAREAYARGYRDGWRAENRRDRYAGGPRAWQPYANGSRWDDRGYGYAYRGDAYPTYRGAAVRGASPYWWGPNGQVHCRRSDGTTGLVVGALAGGTLGNILAREGDKRLGSVIGGTLGAVLGNELARGNVRCR